MSLQSSKVQETRPIGQPAAMNLDMPLDRGESSQRMFNKRRVEMRMWIQ